MQKQKVGAYDEVSHRTSQLFASQGTKKIDRDSEIEIVIKMLGALFSATRALLRNKGVLNRYPTPAQKGAHPGSRVVRKLRIYLRFKKGKPGK